MSPPVFPLRAVAALFLARQHLGRPRAVRLSAPRVTRFVEDVGGLQIDSINVLDRAHYLTLWSRFGRYDRSAFDRLAYRRRMLIEYWAHAACFVPVSHLPWWRGAMRDYRTSHTGWRSWLRKNGRVMRTVEEAIRDRGPLGNADFRRPRSAGKAGGWWSWKPATFALHYLWMTGRVLIHSRVHFQKRFDLGERVFPGLGGGEPPAVDEFRRWHTRRALHAMGAATEMDLRMYLTFPRIGLATRRRALDAMVKSGEVTEVGIQGDRARWFALTEDLPALATAARARRPARGTTLLTPFDSFLWHRERTRRLFGFGYRIEVYTPGHKRTHGYYTLPILHDGQLIGRLDPKVHRKEQRLEVRAVHFERWFAAGEPPPAASWGPLDLDQAMRGVAEALWSLVAFVDAERVTVGRVAPARFGVAFKRALAEARPSAELPQPVASESGALEPA